MSVTHFEVGDIVRLNPPMIKCFSRALPESLRANDQEIRVVGVRRNKKGQLRPRRFPKAHPQLVAVSAGGMKVGAPGLARIKPTYFSGYWFIPL